nr:unnamed protein product [Callosobruchus chinensis]
MNYAEEYGVRFERGFTLQEALELAKIDEAEEIFIEPPDSNVLTDEDSAEEDNGGTLDNLSGNQLRSKVEIKLSNSERIPSAERCEESRKSDPVSEGENRSFQAKKVNSVMKKINLSEKIRWIEEADLVDSPKTVFPSPNYEPYRNMSPVQIFERFVDDDLLDHLVNETRKYALFKNFTDPQISADEIRCFIAILIVTGYDPKPSKKHYWDSIGDLKNSMVSNSMRRDRFIQIMKFIHCADNCTIDGSDKLYKLRPFMSKVKQNFLKHFIPVEHLNFDESMIKYYGRHGCKQFIRGKPIRFGFKMWSLNTSDGYLVNCDVYQGKQPDSNEIYEQTFGKCSAPFVKMDEIPHPAYPYKFYFDNLFTSINLLNYLREKRYGGTGSTCHGVSPIGHVKRYCKSEKKYVQVRRPHLIGEYNRYTGGTDLMDESISAYRIGMRSKKWWWYIFTWLIDACISNAWILWKKAHRDQMSQLDFRRNIAQTYLKRYENVPTGGGRPSTSKFSLSMNRICDDLRYDGLNHILVSIPDKKRRRCAGEGCITGTRTMCIKCDVGMCIECNYIFHTNTRGNGIE